MAEVKLLILATLPSKISKLDPANRTIDAEKIFPTENKYAVIKDTKKDITVKKLGLILLTTRLSSIGEIT